MEPAEKVGDSLVDSAIAIMVSWNSMGIFGHALRLKLMELV